VLTHVLIAIAAGFLLGRLTAPSHPRTPRWAVDRHGLVYWTQPRPDGRTTFIQVPSDTSAAGLADDLNRHGHTPGTLDAAFGRAEGGRL
jgi:hypothetical protein